MTAEGANGPLQSGAEDLCLSSFGIRRYVRRIMAHGTSHRLDMGGLG